MVINTRIGSHQVLLRQLQGSIVLDDPQEASDDLQQDEEDEAQIAMVALGGGTGRNLAEDEEEEEDGREEEEEEEEEDVDALLRQIGPELMQQVRSSGGIGGGGGRDDWGDDATLALLQAWGDKCVGLNKWQLRLDDWAELAAAVTQRSRSPKTDVQCKNRVDTLKKKFKVERQRQSALGLPSNWTFYRILDRLLAMAATSKSSSAAANHGPAANAAVVASFANRSPALPVGADAGSIVRSNKRQRSEDEEEDHESDEEEEQELEAKGGGSQRGGEQDQDEDDHRARRRGRRKRKNSNSSSSSPSDCTSSPLAGAIARLGEIFERMEDNKRQQLLDLERMRMQFTKDLELHRIQLLLQTQRELAKIHQQHNVDIQ